MDWRYNTIWFDQLEQDKVVIWNYKEKKKLPLSLDQEEYAILWYYKKKEVALEGIPPSDKLLYLGLHSANVQDLGGLQRFPGLKRLELHHCTKLEKDHGLLHPGNTIEYLHIDQSKKLQSIEEIAQLPHLKGLRLNDCGALESIAFLKGLPNLIDFRFVNTTVLDGDLTPIIDHPSLRSVGFFNKRHYNTTVQKMDAILASKYQDDNKDFAYKGEFSTFRYK